MYFCCMIVITGAAGFIGSCLVSRFNSIQRDDLIIVDDFSNQNKNKNLSNKKYLHQIDRNIFPEWLSKNGSKISIVYHIGARTDTVETNIEIFNSLNLFYSQKIWNLCADLGIPFIYASSAATYGMGEFGFNDNHEDVIKLKPLNPYAISKNDFDKWVLSSAHQPPYWAGLKFFNIYGPNEFHKGRMASVIFHAYNQIKSTGEMQLFRSHNIKYTDGGQLRDFMYVKDLIDVLVFMLHNKNLRGLYNLGTGIARTFNDLAISVFKALNKDLKITYIDTPLDIRKKYQYFTQANISKLRDIGYEKEFFTLEEGIKDYIINYLDCSKFY